LRDLCAALSNLGRVSEDLGEHGQTQAYFERALQVAERMGDPTEMAFLLSNHAANAYKTGDWGKARAEYERAVTIVHHIGVSWASAYPLIGLGQLCLAQGEWQPATLYLEEAITLAEQCGDAQALRSAVCAEAEWHLLQGRADTARSRLEPLLIVPTQETDITIVLTTLAWAYLSTGELDTAEALLAQIAMEVPEGTSSFDLMDASRVRALAVAQQGRAWEAEQMLEEVLALTQRMHFPYMEAKTLYVYGLLEWRQAEQGQAVGRLEAALAILSRLGERLYAEQAERALREIGCPVPPEFEAGSGG
jgi:eukaryotic-like serine/threonine-protein kinase